MDVSDSKEALKRASKVLNELTGYDQIDNVKRKVNNQAHLFESSRDEVQEAKRNYEQAIETRSNTQRGINELLQRKHLWTGDDVAQFTELYRLEHAHSQAEVKAKETYEACEKKMDREYMELARSMMERYHDEQLWSDKIRSVNTYGTWALMILNLAVFVLVQTVFEPRKRKRLTDRFEELLVSIVEEKEGKFGEVLKSLDEKDRMMIRQQVAVMETLNRLAEHPLFDQETLSSLRRAAKEKEENVFPVPMAPVLVHASDDWDDESSTPGALDNDETSITMVTNVMPSSLPLVIKEKEKVLNDEELSKVILMTPANFEDAPFIKPRIITKEEEEVAVVFSKRDLVMYSIESAVAGGLMTAAVVYLFR
ncbi:Mdm33 family-domain-containing protein [Pilaira anomala]|nr:Mdm33 family-domain-containing protein [Pilaira anomala]